MRSSAILSASFLSLVLSLAAGCTSEDAVVAARLQECDLASEGELGPRLTAALYQPSACYRECLASASCDELDDALCGTSIELLQRCDQRCAYRCPDGSLIGLELVCDGNSQCEGGADEADCPTFDCGDGATVPERARCDGYTSCTTGADEHGCYGDFRCEATWGGTLTGRWSRCNRYVECTDGSDEVGCPEHRCADGSTVVHPEGFSPRCDGSFFCSDGSDEDGCAVLTPMCI